MKGGHSNTCSAPKFPQYSVIAQLSICSCIR